MLLYFIYPVLFVLIGRGINKLSQVVEAGRSVAALIADSNNLSTLRGIDNYASLIQVYTLYACIVRLSMLRPATSPYKQMVGIIGLRPKEAAPIVGYLITSEDILIMAMVHSDTACVKSPVIPHLLQGDLVPGYVLYLPILPHIARTGVVRHNIDRYIKNAPNGIAETSLIEGSK